MNVCCTQLVQENLKLRALMQRERDKRRYLATAYRELFSAYQSLVEQKAVFDSTLSASEFEIEPQYQMGRSERTAKPPASLEVAERHVAVKPRHSTPVVPSAQTETNVDENRAPAQPVPAPTKPSQCPHWYFVTLDEDAESFPRHAAASRLRSLLARTEERSRMIAAVSRRRAQIAANRRAVAMDLLRGRRELDDEALAVLHTDSSRLCAFPAPMMREMRRASQRRSRRFEKQLERERGDTREKQLEMATNKILAHSSAAIAQSVAIKSQAVARLTRSLSSITLGETLAGATGAGRRRPSEEIKAVGASSSNRTGTDRS